MSFNVAFRWAMFQSQLVSEENAGPRMGQTVVQRLTARKSRSADLGKTSMDHESPKENTAFGWLISCGLHYSPLGFFGWWHPCQKGIVRIHIRQPIFSWNVTPGRRDPAAVVCQGLWNFFHNQLPQLRFLGCLKINFNAMVPRVAMLHFLCCDW